MDWVNAIILGLGALAFFGFLLARMTEGMAGQAFLAGTLDELDQDLRTTTLSQRRDLRRKARALTGEITVPVVLSFDLGPTLAETRILIDGVPGSPEWQTMIGFYLAPFLKKGLIETDEPPEEATFADPIFRDMRIRPRGQR